MTIEQRLAEIIRAFCADALSSAVNLNVDLDIMLAALAQALLAALRPLFPDAQDVHVGVVEDGRGLGAEDPARRWPGGVLVDGVAAWWSVCRCLLSDRGAG
jgi:hypothetical protein